MPRTLLLYATTDGHTLKICERLRQVLEGDGHEVALVPIDCERALDLETFDTIVIGASIRYGKHGRAVYAFIEQNARLLARKANAFFSVNIVARKPGRKQPDTNPYVRKFLRQIAWKPQLVEVFAGKLDYPRYGFFDREMIRLIMWMTRGPTDPTAVIEFTDWQQVADFGRRIAALKPIDRM